MRHTTTLFTDRHCDSLLGVCIVSDSKVLSRPLSAAEQVDGFTEWKSSSHRHSPKLPRFG